MRLKPCGLDLLPKVFSQALAHAPPPLNSNSTVPGTLQGHLQSTTLITSIPHEQDTPMQTSITASHYPGCLLLKSSMSEFSNILNCSDGTVVTEEAQPVSGNGKL